MADTIYVEGIYKISADEIRAYVEEGDDARLLEDITVDDIKAVVENMEFNMLPRVWDILSDLMAGAIESVFEGRIEYNQNSDEGDE